MNAPAVPLKIGPISSTTLQAFLNDSGVWPPNRWLDDDLYEIDGRETPDQLSLHSVDPGIHSWR